MYLAILSIYIFYFFICKIRWQINFYFFISFPCFPKISFHIHYHKLKNKKKSTVNCELLIFKNKRVSVFSKNNNNIILEKNNHIAIYLLINWNVFTLTRNLINLTFGVICIINFSYFQSKTSSWTMTIKIS